MRESISYVLYCNILLYCHIISNTVSERRTFPSYITLQFNPSITQPLIMPELVIRARTLRALQAIQNNPKLNTRRAESMYDVSERRLLRRRQGI